MSGLYIPGYGYTNDPENQAAVQAEAARRRAQEEAAREAQRAQQREELLGRDWAAEGAGSRPAEGLTAAQRAARDEAAGAVEDAAGEVVEEAPVEPGGAAGGTTMGADAATAALLAEVNRLRQEVEESRRVDPFEAARQQRRANQAAMRAAIAWLPSALVDTYVDEWVKTGDAELSWAVVRQSGQYDQYFPQNRRPDGTLRMTEQDYLSHKDAFRRELTQYGLNPDVFEDRHQDLVAGEVSAQEFRQRIDAKVTGVLQNLPEVRRRFGQFYGIQDMTDEALLAASLDPNIGTELLQGRITAAQISGEALRAGFERGLEESEMLAGPGGLDQMRAREFFSEAATAVPMFGRFAERFGGGQFGIAEYEQAAVFGESSLQRRMRRLHASEMALFRQGPVTEVGQMGEMAGLRRR